MRCILLLQIILLCLLASLSYGGPGTKTIRAIRAEKTPDLNGLLTDSLWQTAPAALDFTQYDPEEGALPTELTSVRILYDNRALYIGVICYDSRPEQIVRQLTRRDRTAEADRFSVMIDSYHDHQTAFLFSTNVSGVQSDGVLSQDGTIYDVTWDAVWSVKTRTYRDGWWAVFEIPYNTLRFSRPDGNLYEWGINFRRYISRKHETDEWVMVPRKDVLPGTVSSVSKMGHVTGIEGIDPPLHLTLIPYVLGKSTFETAVPTRPASVDNAASAGLDIKFGLTRDFTLDATINPDFGQVEVDQAVLNLTVFETRFPEKRPFFIEGAQVFTFGSSIDNTPLSLFFSRRIGKQPTGSSSVAALPGVSSVENNPQVTTILGAAKITGHSNSGFSLGVLSAATGEETATVKDTLGTSKTVVTEPRGSLSVVRLKQDFDGGSWIGALATLSAKQTMLPAISGGIDWNLRMGDGTYTLDGYIAGAQSSGDAENRNGAAGRLLFSRFAAEHWLFTGSYDFYTRYFNCNDIGFFAQPHDHGGYVQLLYRENFASGIFRRYSVSAVPEFRVNWDGVITRAVTEVSFGADLVNFWQTQFSYDYSLPAYDDEERGIIGTYRRPTSHLFRLLVNSDQRASVWGTITGSYEADQKNKRSFTASVGLTIRPASWVELNPLVYYVRSRHEEAWVFPIGSTPSITGSQYSLFGDRAVDEMDLSLRGIVMFTRTLSLQFFTQVLLARGTYENYRILTSSTQLDPYNFAGSTNDFNEIRFNANALLRWEYVPGSTLYLVWTQARSGDSGNYGTGFGSRFGDTFSLPHEDVIALKVSYWFPF